MHEAELEEKKCRLARGRAEGSQSPTNVPHSKICSAYTSNSCKTGMTVLLDTYNACMHINMVPKAVDTSGKIPLLHYNNR